MGKKNYCPAVVFCFSLFIACIYAPSTFDDLVNFQKGANRLDRRIGIRHHPHPRDQLIRSHHSHNPMHNEHHNFVRYSSDIASEISNKVHGKRPKLPFLRNEYLSGEIRSKPGLKHRRTGLELNNANQRVNLGGVTHDRTAYGLDDVRKQVRSKSGSEQRRTGLELDKVNQQVNLGEVKPGKRKRTVYGIDGINKQVRSEPRSEFRRTNYKLHNTEEQARSLHDTLIEPAIFHVENGTEIDSSSEEPSRICFSKTTILIIAICASVIVIALVAICPVSCWLIKVASLRGRNRSFEAGNWWSYPSSSGKESDFESLVLDEDGTSFVQNSALTLKLESVD